MITDPCCGVCRTPYGCRDRKCFHHLEVEAHLARENNYSRRTYRNPTEDQAIRNIMNPTKRKRP